MGAGESFESNLWRSTFQLQSKNSRLGIIRLTDKQTEDSYICRKVSVLDKKQIEEIDRLVDIKLSIQSPYVVKLQKATNQSNQQYCAYGKTYYLLFKQPYQTLKQQTLTRKFKNSLYSQSQLEMMLEVGIKALYFLKNINHSHESISSTAFFVNENRSMILGDPFMFSRDGQPAKVRNGFVYPSPELIRFQNHQIEGYNKHLSDLFTFGLVLLEVFCMINMDCVYEKYFERVNHEVINQKLSTIKGIDLRKKLFILLDPEPKNRELIFKHYIKSIPAKDIFLKLQKEKFKKTIDQYNLATSQVTEWKNDIVNVENRLMSSSAEGKRTFSVSTNQNPSNNNEEKLVGQQYQCQERQPLLSRYVQAIQPLRYGDQYQSNNNYQLKNNYQRSYNNFQANQLTPSSISNQPHIQLKYSPQNNQSQYQTQISQHITFQKTFQPYHHQTIYGDVKLPSQIQTNNFGHFRPVQSPIQSTYQNYQSNYIPSHSSPANYSPPLFQNYQKDYQTQSYPFSNLSYYSPPIQQKHFQTVPSISPKINDISIKEVKSNVNQFPYYQTHINQSQQPQAIKVGVQMKTKNPENVVTINSQNLNQIHKQKDYKDSDVTKVTIPTPQKTPESTKISPIKKQPQTVNKSSTYNTSQQIDSQNKNTLSSTPAKQKNSKQVQGDYGKYRHLSTINQRSEMAESFISELHDNKSQILIQQVQQDDLNAQTLRDCQSEREKISNSFVEQSKVWSITYPSGTKYMGEVKNDKRNGLGTFFYIDGSKYHGHWLDNKMNGFGTLYYPNGKIAYQGEWKMDNFHGKGKVFNDQIESFNQNYHYENCADIDNYWLEYDGELSEDRKQGKGTLKLANGEYFDGQFKNDELNGYCRFYTRDNRIIEGLWESSRLVKVISERIKE